MKKDLPKAYEHKQVEEKLAQKWQSAGLFKMDLSSKKKPFTILIPPPNITGALHMGHALTNTIQDVLIRYHKMQDRNAYWVAGTDHGGIATQNVIEKKLFAEQKKTRADFSRDEFLKILWDWYQECGDTILYQFEKMGWSLDLEDVRFTMDDIRAKAVYTAFEKLWKDKKIYRGKRMINWCPRCHTALSDIEVEHEPQNGKLWHIQYPLENGKKGIVIATTRPETMLADTGVAVHPKDSRYQHLIGENLKLPLTNRIIPIVADKEVDKEFGTGAVKITPAHDPLDYEIGQRHKLPIVTVISESGKMIDCPKKYIGMSVQKARQEVAKDLEEKKFLVKTEKHKNNVSTCYRCHSHIEPYLSEQWFVKMDSLAEKAIKEIKKGKVEYTPPTWKNQTLHWLGNIQDWCISRQIIWGHRIPVWYCKDCGEKGLMKMGKGEKFALSLPAKCGKCKSKKLYQDEDVLDTWFSSALWPLSTFGWPEKSQELKTFYPSDVMQTGYEIIYLWVARMIMFGLYFKGEVPFKQVSLNGIVRDKTGKKMSKSLGNVVDPLGLIDKYGADAVRFSLLMQASPGKDIPYGEGSIVGARNFTNKIYNAARFLMMHLEGIEGKLEMPKKLIEQSDNLVLSNFTKTLSSVRLIEEDFDFFMYSTFLYHFLWTDYCDWYLESIKPRLAKDGKEKREALSVAVNIFYQYLKALHPLMPFITEDLAEYFGKYIGEEEDFLVNKKYPSKSIFPKPCVDEENMHKLKVIVGKIREIRSQFSIPPKNKIKVILITDQTFFIENQHYITDLAKLEGIKFDVKAKRPEKSAMAVVGDIKIYVPLGDFIDIEKERERLRKDLDKKVKDYETYNARLSNKGFTEKAPKEKVQEFKEKVEILQKEILEIEEALKSLEK